MFSPLLTASGKARKQGCVTDFWVKFFFFFFKDWSKQSNGWMDIMVIIISSA